MGSFFQKLIICAILALSSLATSAASAFDGVVQIQGSERNHTFQIEIADDLVERNRGLMFRETLARDAGMLFIYESPLFASFWMKNTLIPLDLIFIRGDGTITQISENAVPGSLESIRSRELVIAVLEINGGQARELGIVPGDRLRLFIPPATSE